jgi:hypothetical protein
MKSELHAPVMIQHAPFPWKAVSRNRPALWLLQEAKSSMTNLVLERNADRDTSVVADYPPFHDYSAWSEQERRWIGMTFDEYQAWLARPDLDPAEFASGEVAS